MDDGSHPESAWTTTEHLPDAERISPYVHWARSVDEPGEAKPLQDVFNIRTPWLKKAVAQILGDGVADWPALVPAALPNACFGPTKTASKSRPMRRLPHAQSKVIMAIIDDSIAFAHERFRLSNLSTRVDYLWLQGAAHTGEGQVAPFGREISRAQINFLLGAHAKGPGGDTVDEDSLYREAGALDMSSGQFQSLARRAGHGTAVIDLASGFALDAGRRDRMFQSLPDRMGVDPDTYDLALVSIPQSVTADTSGTYAEMFILLGLIRLLDHVEQRCQAEGEDYPVILNLSFGLSAGPKDGSSLLDRFVDAIERYRGDHRAPLRLVVPSGNHRQGRSFVRISQPITEDSKPLFWTLQPDDKTPSFLEIWSAPIEKRPAHLPVTLGLRPPLSSEVATLFEAELDRVYTLDLPQSGHVRAYIQWVQHKRQPGRYRICLAVPPTVPTAPGKPFVSPGDWQITINGQIGLPREEIGWPLDMTIQRDDMIPGFRNGGRQSRFEDSQYRERDEAGFIVQDDPAGPAYIRRGGALNALATADSTVVVGGCYADTLEPVGYAGTGSAALGLRTPDVVAPASVSRRRAGINAAGNRSGSRISVEGTSVAAPTMARELAKASRPAAERPKLSGVPLLRSSMSAGAVPTVLPVAEDVEKSEAYFEDIPLGISGATKA